MDDMIAWLKEQLDAHEEAAKAAIDPERPGRRWHWVDPSDDTPARPDGDGYLRGASLRTVEEFPSRLSEKYGQGNDLPAFVIYTAEEMRAGVGTHIVLHDPEAVLADVEAKRAVLDLADPGYLGAEMDGWWEAHEKTIRLLAAAYRHRPGWKDEWAV